jgi:hypothetical protein
VDHSATAAPAGAMPDCDDARSGTAHVDTANVCGEHCKLGQQNSNPAPQPVAMAASATVLYVLQPLDEAIAAGLRASAPDRLLGAVPPPHAILHCVLRI